MNMYTLFDRKLREHGQIVLANNDEACKRALKDGLSGSGSTVEKYPEDFDLMCVGSFDSETGMVVPIGIPKLVENVSNLLPKKDGV